MEELQESVVHNRIMTRASSFIKLTLAYCKGYKMYVENEAGWLSSEASERKFKRGWG